MNRNSGSEEKLQNIRVFTGEERRLGTNHAATSLTPTTVAKVTVGGIAAQITMFSRLHTSQGVSCRMCIVKKYLSSIRPKRVFFWKGLKTIPDEGSTPKDEA
ncbi:hypothetical protein CVT25_002036 [Psilocybe cyanescens]|uniref:Uncharacterized protein n=1 Tax=Psilocybe cyanescens TaxID=93625 RepID=A0A409X088_PSICY|nr:hypothetical protein CVT25_002036 [Psilocybe cyanescens]